MGRRKLEMMDWFVIAYVLLVLVSMVVNPIPSGMPASWMKFDEVFWWFVSLSNIPVLAIWMFMGGVSSPLWRWLPPFWPWGKLISSPKGRWAIVAALIVGMSPGYIANVRYLLGLVHSS